MGRVRDMQRYMDHFGLENKQEYFQHLDRRGLGRNNRAASVSPARSSEDGNYEPRSRSEDPSDRSTPKRGWGRRERVSRSESPQYRGRRRSPVRNRRRSRRQRSHYRRKNDSPRRAKPSNNHSENKVSRKRSPTVTREEQTDTKNSNQDEKEARKNSIEGGKDARIMRMSKEVNGKDARLANDSYPPLSVDERKKVMTLDNDLCSLLEGLKVSLDCVESAVELLESKPGIVDNEFSKRMDWLSSWLEGTHIYLDERKKKIKIVDE